MYASGKFKSGFISNFQFKSFFNKVRVSGFFKSGFPQIYFCPIESMSTIPFFLYIFDKNLANIII